MSGPTDDRGAGDPSTSGIDRRTFLAWVGGTAIAAAALPNLACTSDDARPPGTTVPGTVPPPARETRDLHFSLGDSVPDGTTAIVGTTSYPLAVHTADSRRQLAGSAGALAGADLQGITHYVQGADLAGDRPVQVSIVGPPQADGSRTVLAGALIPPSAASQAVHQAVGASGRSADVYQADQRLRALSVPSPGDTAPGDWPTIDTLNTDVDTAASLVFKHPLLLDTSAQGGAVTLGLIYSLTTLPALTDQITLLRTTKGGYRKDVPVVVAGQPAQFPPAGYTPPTPPATTPMDIVPAPVQPLTAELDDSLTPLLSACVKEAITRVRNSGEVAAVRKRPPASLVAPRRTTVAIGRPGSRGDASEIQVGLSGQCVDGQEHGVRVTLTDDQPENAAGQPIRVNLQVSNDYSRFLGVYVQYFDVSGKQIPVTPTSGADTAYATSVALVMPVLTEAGVPIPGSSTREFTLELPQGASSARILNIGLGNSRFDTPDWSSYFVDANGNQVYENLLSPPEATLAIALTCVVNFGFPAAMLALDSMAANGYQEVVDTLREATDDDEDVDAAATATRDLAEGIEKVEGVSTLLGRFVNFVLGGLDYQTEMDAEGTTDPSFLDSAWSLVKSMGLAFSEFIGLKLLNIIVEMMVEADADKAAEALPIVGEAFAIVSALIDAANLAEAAYDTATAPFVMATEVAITYPMSVSVEHDPRSATMPEQAQSFQVTVQVAPDAAGGGGQGAAAGRVLVASGALSDYLVDDGRRLTVEFPAVPFGGRLSVQAALWSDPTPGRGWQAGGGTSPWFPNGNPDQLPAPDFAITQNVVPINAQSTLAIYNTTVFDSYTFPYDPFYFSPDPGPNDGTAATLAAQGGHPYPSALGNISFSSPSNAVAYTFQSNFVSDRWFIRGYALQPSYEPDIDTDPGQRFAGPYPARPWVLYDPLETDSTNGQHFILEPQQGGGYHVRKVSLTGSNPVATGTPFPIDTTSSWGRFLLPLDDVAIYHQGFIVGVSAATGTLSILRLSTAAAPNPQAQKAKGFAGPALSADAPPGLLLSPSKVAVTMDGTILVLEPPANRLQAFNLAGAPVAHFPPTSQYPDGSPFAALVTSGRTYLGLSVDGGGAIYVLSAPEDGKGAPEDYRLDVYGADGGLVYTATRINVGAVAVDYFRNVHGLNYVPLMNEYLDVPQILDTGTPATPTLEPSISSWYTTAPGAEAPPDPIPVGRPGSTLATTTTSGPPRPPQTLQPPGTTTTTRR